MWGDALDYLTDASSWWGRTGLVRLTIAHLQLSIAAVATAIVLAAPPAVWLAHRGRGDTAVTAVNLSRAVPTFAVIAFVFPLSLRYGFGLGFWPTFVALVLLGLPPVFVNAHLGVRGVPPEVVEAARAMGMRPREVVARVELPAALPLVLTGMRITSVQVVATTTLGALVGFRCLGTPILQALATRDQGRLLVSAGLVAVLALAVDGAFALLGRRLAPWSRPPGVPTGTATDLLEGAVPP